MFINQARNRSLDIFSANEITLRHPAIWQHLNCNRFGIDTLSFHQWSAYKYFNLSQLLTNLVLYPMNYQMFNSFFKLLDSRVQQGPQYREHMDGDLVCLFSRLEYNHETILYFLIHHRINNPQHFNKFNTHPPRKSDMFLWRRAHRVGLKICCYFVRMNYEILKYFSHLLLL